MWLFEWLTQSHRHDAIPSRTLQHLLKGLSTLFWLCDHMIISCFWTNKVKNYCYSQYDIRQENGCKSTSWGVGVGGWVLLQKRRVLVGLRHINRCILYSWSSDVVTRSKPQSWSMTSVQLCGLFWSKLRSISIHVISTDDPKQETMLTHQDLVGKSCFTLKDIWNRCMWRTWHRLHDKMTMSHSYDLPRPPNCIYDLTNTIDTWSKDPDVFTMIGSMCVTLRYDPSVRSVRQCDRCGQKSVFLTHLDETMSVWHI